MHALRVDRLYRSIDLIHIRKPQNIVSYQASSSYNLEEFVGVITLSNLRNEGFDPEDGPN